jgi:hypothetical protein
MLELHKRCLFLACDFAICILLLIYPRGVPCVSLGRAFTPLLPPQLLCGSPPCTTHLNARACKVLKSLTERDSPSRRDMS